MAAKTETATLAGGCFWCIEAAFDMLRGVSRVESGYAGGRTDSPTYEQVCTGTTGHAEVAQIEFDPDVIGYRDLLDVFFTVHDPTTLNRQGGDIGTQYRSAIFYHTPEQKAIAEASKEEAQKRFDTPIVTEITPASNYWRAEEYHQRYAEKHGLGSCHI